MQASPERRNRNRRRRPQQGHVLHSYESNGPDVKVRGTPQTIVDKYTQLARDALGSGDLVLAENYFQHAEHYVRLMILDEVNIPPRSSHALHLDGSAPEVNGEDASNVAALEPVQRDEREMPLHDEPRSYNRPHRNREHNNGERHFNGRDRGRPSSHRYRSSLPEDHHREEGRSESHKRLDRHTGFDSRRDHDSGRSSHGSRRGWSQSPGRDSHNREETQPSASATFNESGLPAFLAAPVAARSTVPPLATESSLLGGHSTDVGIQKLEGSYPEFHAVDASES